MFDESAATGQEMSQQSTITRSVEQDRRKLPEVQCNENDEQTIQHLIGCLQVEEPMSASEYLEIDNYLLGEIERIPTDEDVIETVTGIETPENREQFRNEASIIF